MQLSTEDMKRLMVGGASTYENAEGQPSAVEYWIQAYLGASLWLSSENKNLPRSPSSEDSKPPALPALQKAFQQWMEDPNSWDERELLLLCKAYQLDLPAHYLAQINYHTRQRHRIGTATLIQAKQTLNRMGTLLPKARLFAEGFEEKEFLSLSPLDKKLCVRFQWLTREAFPWVGWIAHGSTKEQGEILLDNIYHSARPVPQILHTLNRTKSKKLRALLQIHAWKMPLEKQAVDLPKGLIPLSAFLNTSSQIPDIDFPQPPLINTPLHDEERARAWLPLIDPPSTTKNPPDDLHIHAALVYGNKKYLQNAWAGFSPNPKNEELYKAAAKLLPPDFFLSNYAKRATETSFPPDQIDLAYKWLFLSDVFIPAEQSPSLWTLMEDWSEMSEIQEKGSTLRRMARHFANRLHPSALSKVEKDPFDIFEAPVRREWEEQINKRRSLYQTLAKWQKNK